MTKAKKSIEEQLLPDSGASSVYLSLDNVGNGDYLSLDSTDSAKEPEIASVLHGEEAAKFLRLPIRAHMHLQRGDYSRINRRFKDLHEYFQNRSKAERMNYDPDVYLWKQITVRVWNKANIAKLNATQIVGKKMADCPSLGIEGGQYTGELMDGRALSTFLSEVRNADRFRDYLVQLVSVKVTEEMKDYG